MSAGVRALQNEALVGAAGYDVVVVDRLAWEDARRFPLLAGLSMSSAGLGGVGVAVGVQLALGQWWLSLLLLVGGAAFVANLLRLQHAGSGYPLHLPFEGIDRYRPSLTAAVVMFGLGAMLLQPFVLVGLGAGVEGFIATAHRAWARPSAAAGMTAACAMLFAAPAWMRFVFRRALRAYEREKWVSGRMLVDDAYALRQEQVADALAPVPGFSGELTAHYGDPPYNTRPLRYGIDPLDVEKKGVRFVRKWRKQKPAPAPPDEAPFAPQAAPEPEPVSIPEPEPIELPEPEPVELYGPEPVEVAEPEPVELPEPDAPPAPEPEASGEPEAGRLFDDEAEDEAEEVPPALTYLDVGRMTAGRAHRHAEQVAPFVSELTGRGKHEVKVLMRLAPPDMRMHRLFSEWTRLPVVLQHDAAFARDHGLEPILALVVGRSRQEVARRLKAAPGTARLSRVFAPELARRVLGKRA